MILGLPAAAELVRWSGQPRFRSFALLTALAIAAYFGCTELAALFPSTSSTPFPGVLRCVAACLFLIAGVFQLTHWRLTTDPRIARGATVLLLIGAAMLCLPLIGPRLQHSPALSHLAPAARLLFTVPVLLLLATSSPPESGRRGHPLWLAGGLFLAWIAASSLVPAVAQHRLASLLDSRAVWEAAEWLTCLSWLALAARASRARVAEAAASTRSWVAIALMLMGVSEAIKADELAHQPSALAPSLWLQLAAAAIAVGLSSRNLRRAFAGQLQRLDVLARALAETQNRLSRSESIQRERIHDARSAVAGVAGAVRLLTLPRDGADTDRLRGLMSAELDRLQRSLHDPAEEPIVDFCLAEVLDPVVAAHRLAGGVAHADFDRARVAGRPLASANALGNLLANVRSHAPGSKVELHSVRTGATVVLTVDDDGPGLSPAEQLHVLSRGGRGRSAGPGTGLGLHTALQGMIAQSGSLRLVESPAGGTRVILTWPAGDAGDAVATGPASASAAVETARA